MGKFTVKGKTFEKGTHIMAILNATDDSFFSQSRIGDDAISRAEFCIENGAEILDIGGQSTRPNATEVSAIEEMSRVLPAIEAVRSKFNDIPISVDTFSHEVAEACIMAGADMVNDTSCLGDGMMARLIAKSGVSICVMYNRRNSTFPDLFTDKFLGLQAAVQKLTSLGVPQEKILLDGGIGFNKSKDEDFALLDGYDKLMRDFPHHGFLLGASRKSMFGGEVSSRLSATLDSTRLAVKKGVLFVRVHDIAENHAVIRTFSPEQQ